MFVFHYSNPKLTALLLLQRKPHEYDLPYQHSQSQWGLGLGEIRYGIRNPCPMKTESTRDKQIPELSLFSRSLHRS